MSPGEVVGYEFAAVVGIEAARPVLEVCSDRSDCAVRLEALCCAERADSVSAAWVVGRNCVDDVLPAKVGRVFLAGSFVSDSTYRLAVSESNVGLAAILL